MLAGNTVTNVLVKQTMHSSERYVSTRKPVFAHKKILSPHLPQLIDTQLDMVVFFFLSKHKWKLQQLQATGMYSFISFKNCIWNNC